MLPDAQNGSDGAENQQGGGSEGIDLTPEGGGGGSHKKKGNKAKRKGSKK
jgi:hypothetical protein